MIVLNELEYAEDCLKHKRIDTKPYFTLSILAKYYFYHLGYNRGKIIASLISFLSDTYPKYQKEYVYWNDTIEKIAGNVEKYTLYEIEGVWITENELHTIESIKNKVLERLAFTMLCLAKLSAQRNPKSNGWVNDGAKSIFSLARISGSVTDRYVRISELYGLGLIELPKKNDLLSYRVTFIDNESKNVLFIHDFRELGYEYLKYRGQNFIRCAECGILVRGNKAGTKRFCSNCVAYTPRKTKNIVCVDCGRMFEVNPKNNNSCRCTACQKKRDREKAKTRKKEQRKRENSRHNTDKYKLLHDQKSICRGIDEKTENEINK